MITLATPGVTLPETFKKFIAEKYKDKIILLHPSLDAKQDYLPEGEEDFECRIDSDISKEEIESAIQGFFQLKKYTIKKNSSGFGIIRDRYIEKIITLTFSEYNDENFFIFTVKTVV